MRLYRALFFILLLYIIQSTQITTAAAPPYTPTDLILLSCGASVNLNDTSGRLWDSDASSRYAPANAAAASSTSAASLMAPSVFAVPYRTARFFRSSFTYTFPVSEGPKFLRLYFHPTIYSDFDASRSFFSLKANNDFALLSNFSSYLYSINFSQPSFVKEFVINVKGNQRLVLTFSPSSGSFGFVNGIEIVSIPNKLYFQGNDVGIKTPRQLFYLNENTALENLYRLNVGGVYVGIEDDTGMFRSWSQDDDYMLFADPGWAVNRKNVSITYTPQTPPYSAPALVYSTARAGTEPGI